MSKEWELFKRDSKGRVLQPTAEGYRERPYYVSFKIRGVEYLRSLGTNNGDAAMAEANRLYEAQLVKVRGLRSEALDQIIDPTKLKQISYTGTSKVLEAYTNYPGRSPNEQTRHVNIGRFDRFWKLLGTRTPEDMTRINEDAVRQWKIVQLKEAKAEGIEDDDIEYNRHLFSANSTLLQLRAIFSDAMMEYYTKDLKLVLPPCIKGFREVSGFKDLPPIVYNAPAEALIQRTLKAWEMIEDRNQFLMIGSILCGGLRKRELSV